MSDAPPLRAVVLGHGDMPAGLVDAVRHITGCEPDVITPVSNRGMSPDALAAALRDALGSDAGIVFTDLQSGSCGFVARRLTQTFPGLVVISGVNLPVLLEFAMNRSLPLDDLVPRLLEAGRSSIDRSPSAPDGHEHRAVPR